MQEAITQYLQENGFETFAPKAVLFDMDGVLYDSMPNHAIAWQRSMAEFNIEMTAADAYATEGARGIDTIRLMVKKQKGEDITLEEAQHMYDVKTRIFHDMAEASIFPGTIQLMEKIVKAGMQIIVVTGSGQRPLIQRLVNDFEVFLSPKKVVTAYDVEKGKPAPDPYLKGLEKAGGLKPWEAIVVENAPLGIRAGVAAHIFTVAINSGPLPDEVLTREGANLLFPTISDFSQKWNDLLRCINPRPSLQDHNWNLKYKEVMDYMVKYRRRPSKHRLEEHNMLSWVKHNKKLMATGKMKTDRIERFNHLLEQAEKFRRVNQHAYLTHTEQEPDIWIQ